MASSKAKYEAFLINNVSTISTLESSLRSITWFLPGRFKDAELASESLTSLLNLISMYHDTLLARVVKANPSYRPLIPTSLHTRFTKAWSDKDSLYKWTSRVLQVINYTELVVEMMLRRKVSEKARWRTVILIETIKASLRLLLLKITRRPLLSPPIPEREFDPTTLPPSSNSTSPTLAPSSAPASPPMTPEHLRNNHVPLEPHPLLTPSHSDVSPEEFLLPKALTTSSVKPSLTLIRTLSGPGEWLAEVVYILRPLVYACLLVADRRKPERSNRALVTALIMEMISRQLRRNPPPSASLERSEYARRDKDILWYLLRGSIWESYTRPKLESLVSATSHTPILGLFGALLKDWIPLIDDYYYSHYRHHADVVLVDLDALEVEFHLTASHIFLFLYTMSEPLSLPLPPLRRVVTSHDADGKSIIQSDVELPSEDMEQVKGARSASIWITTDSIPTNDNNKSDDGGKRGIDNPSNLDLVHPTGTNLRSTDLAPLAITPMHRTSSLDYNILGEVILINEDGTEKLLKNPGDVVIQKGTMHAWRNPSQDQWARWVTVLIAADPVVINGKQLGPEFKL
ncbi:hypothetical protein CVT26_008936 [Gymnopilus dilepis]|uniref:Peroxisomal membrane protein PEX16 n=1 Tax=Gymnopilus dilepis TaxID=231916 RepID=A0A409YRQ1_9AGAR|nr:hypothetical protein CVT26_008936 [Gymnopilus dilepis]